MKTLSLVTLKDWLNWVAEQLEAAELYFGHGTDNAWDEAVQLVLYAANLSPYSGREVLSLEMSEVQKNTIIDLVYQRIQLRKPLSYLTKEAWFAGLLFYVDERVIIPRSPFAEWIERGFEPWVTAENVQRILDLGTGSGCMAIAAALAFPNAQVDAVEVSINALTVAAINIKRHELENRITLIQSDGFENVASQKYDVIMSNPPYVNSQEMQQLPAEYRHEPSQALYAGDEGLAIIEMILNYAGQYLTKQGVLVVEVGNSEEALIMRYPRIPFLWLEQERGGEGLFLLTAEQLQHYFS